MTEPSGSVDVSGDGPTSVRHDDVHLDEHFHPKGTVFVLALFVATIILLWASVYIILLSRGVTL